MKNILIAALLLSAMFPLKASDPKADERKQQATRAVFAQLIHPLTPPLTWRESMSRARPIRAKYYDLEILDENTETPGEFSFRVRERHRVVGKKAHPRDGLIVFTGHYAAKSGDVYVFDRRSNRFMPAHRLPQVIDGKKNHARQREAFKREYEAVKLKAQEK